MWIKYKSETVPVDLIIEPIIFWWNIIQPIAFGVTISNLESRIVSNIQLLTFSILIVDLNSQRYEVHLVDQGT